MPGEETGDAINPMALLERLTHLTQAITLQQTQMMAMQIAAVTNPPPVAQPVAITDGLIRPSPIDVKMDGTNYAFWCQTIEMYVKGREQMNHLTGVPAPPDRVHPHYHKWEVDDVVVKGWLINSLEPRLRGKYIRHPTARDVWQALATTFYDGSDEAQVFALNRRVSHLKQDGKSVEEFYDELHGLWQEIDFRSPNPMICSHDIEAFNTFIQKGRVYSFLDGLDDRLDNIRAQVLQMSPFPSLDQAYAHVRRESNRQGIMIKNGQEIVQNSVAMAARGYRPREVNSITDKLSNFVDKNKLKCSHCGGSRHTKEQCFELVGYPEWWKNNRKKQQLGGYKGRANHTTTSRPASGSDAPQDAPALPGDSDKAAPAVGGLAAAIMCFGGSSGAVSESNVISGEGSPHERDNWPWY